MSNNIHPLTSFSLNEHWHWLPRPSDPSHIPTTSGDQKSTCQTIPLQNWVTRMCPIMAPLTYWSLMQTWVLTMIHQSLRQMERHILPVLCLTKGAVLFWSPEVVGMWLGSLGWAAMIQAHSRRRKSSRNGCCRHRQLQTQSVVSISTSTIAIALGSCLCLLDQRATAFRYSPVAVAIDTLTTPNCCWRDMQDLCAHCRPAW